MANHHFPMVFLWFSQGFSYSFPMVTVCELIVTNPRVFQIPLFFARWVPPISQNPGEYHQHLKIHVYVCIYIYMCIYIYIFVYICDLPIFIIISSTTIRTYMVNHGNYIHISSHKTLYIWYWYHVYMYIHINIIYIFKSNEFTFIRTSLTANSTVGPLARLRSLRTGVIVWHYVAIGQYFHHAYAAGNRAVCKQTPGLMIL